MADGTAAGGPVLDGAGAGDGDAPVLLAVAHGTRDPAGPAAVRALLGLVRAVRPGLRVVEAYGELAAPSLEDAAAGLGGGPAVVVPLLLARGYHALIDFPERAGRALPHAVTARPLGPDPLLAPRWPTRSRARSPARRTVRRRVRRRVRRGGRAGLSRRARTPWSSVRRGPPIRRARPTCGRRRGCSRAGSRRSRAGTRPGSRGGASRTASSPGPDPRWTRSWRGCGAAARIAWRSRLDLLAPGRFHDRMAACGADVVAPPIGAHPAVARLVLRRYDEARRRLETAVAMR